MGGPPDHALPERVPHLQGPQPQLPRRGVTAAEQPIRRACRDLETAGSRRGQSVAEIRITWERSPGTTKEGDHRGVVIGVLQPRRRSAGPP